MRMRLAKKAFTIIELVIVITVLALLVTLVMARYQTVAEEAKYAQVATNLITIRSAISRFYNYNSTYPTLTDIQELADMTHIELPTVNKSEIWDFIETVPNTPSYIYKAGSISPSRAIYSFNATPLADQNKGGWVYDETRGVIYPNLPMTQFGASDWWIENSNF
ncbi:MAG: prepilin-type N-terminal cleavage/methylation domain-containing protein [Candidatus Wallbacteria bacterium]|nr:prepilin-type N-terminal cleavage/methylation domain-containing protein [Candidatus Wallbacteria bacterium]